MPLGVVDRHRGPPCRRRRILAADERLSRSPRRPARTAARCACRLETAAVDRTARAHRRGGRRPRRCATTCCARWTRRRPDIRRGDHRVAGLLDAAGRPGVRQMAGRAGPREQCRCCPIPLGANGTATNCGAVQPADAATTRSPPMPGRRCSRRSRSPGSTRPYRMVLTGNGESFCSGGDLAEFGTFDRSGERASGAHAAQPGVGPRRDHRAAGKACRAEVHGQVLGSGLEMAAFCGHVTLPARRDARAARAGARPDPRRGRDGQHHPADRPLAHGVSGAVGSDHRRRRPRWTGASSTSLIPVT